MRPTYISWPNPMGLGTGWRARSRLAGTQILIGWPMPMACTQPQPTHGHPRTPLPPPPSGRWPPIIWGTSADQWGWAGRLIGLRELRGHSRVRHILERVTRVRSHTSNLLQLIVLLTNSTQAGRAYYDSSYYMRFEVDEVLRAWRELGYPELELRTQENRERKSYLDGTRTSYEVHGVRTLRFR